MTVELRHLRAFLAIADEGSITRAAAALHVTQPALSRTLRQLEAHLGVRLVDRSTHHLHLTSVGRRYRDRVAKAVAALDDVLDPATVGSSPLRLSHAWSALGDHTVVLLRRWAQAHPDIPLELHRVDDRSAGLLRGSADVAILRGPVELPNVRLHALPDERRVVAVAADHPLAVRAELRPADLTGATMALNSVSGTTTTELWPRGDDPGATIDVGNTDDWLATIAAGRAIGVSSIATAAMYPHPGVRYIPLADVPPIEVQLAWLDPPGHPAVAELVALVDDVVGQSADRNRRRTRRS